MGRSHCSLFAVRWFLFFNLSQVNNSCENASNGTESLPRASKRTQEQIANPEGGHGATRENRFAVRLQLIVHRPSAGPSDARAKAKTARTVRNQVCGQWPAPRKTACWISTDGARWLSHQRVRREFQVSALADDCSKRRHLSR